MRNMPSLLSFYMAQACELWRAARLRIKDIEYDRSAIIIREGKGAKDRVVMLPESLRIDLMAQVARCKLLWLSNTERQMSGVEMPFALDIKYPRAGHSLAWLGFGYFRSMYFRLIRAAVLFDVTILSHRRFGGHLRRLLDNQGFINLLAHILCAIALPRIFYNLVAIFVLYKTC